MVVRTVKQRIIGPTTDRVTLHQVHFQIFPSLLSRLEVGLRPG